MEILLKKILKKTLAIYNLIYTILSTELMSICHKELL